MSEKPATGGPGNPSRCGPGPGPGADAGAGAGADGAGAGGAGADGAGAGGAGAGGAGAAGAGMDGAGADGAGPGDTRADSAGAGGRTRADQAESSARADLTYGTYLRLDDLLACQSPLTDQHDELLFVIIHQVYELWFKQILHEAELLTSHLEAGAGAPALATARRMAKILKTVVGQLDILETMTPQQFASFRPELGGSSGFQSAQFRYLEAVLGRRDFSPSVIDSRLAGLLTRRPLFDSLLRYLAVSGYPVSEHLLHRDPRLPWQPDDTVQRMLLDVYAAADTPSEICESLVDIDEGVQEWRYRHVKMVERIIGLKTGTGGSDGSAYLRSTLFRPAFPDLWEIRSRL